MASDPHPESFVAQAAAQRLAAPGVLDQRSLRSQRVAPQRGSALVERLLSRMGSEVTPHAVGMPWRLMHRASDDDSTAAEAAAPQPATIAHSVASSHAIAPGVSAASKASRAAEASQARSQLTPHAAAGTAEASGNSTIDAASAAVPASATSMTARLVMRSHAPGVVSARGFAQSIAARPSTATGASLTAMRLLARSTGISAPGALPTAAAHHSPVQQSMAVAGEQPRTDIATPSPRSANAAAQAQPHGRALRGDTAALTQPGEPHAPVPLNEVSAPGVDRVGKGVVHDELHATVASGTGVHAAPIERIDSAAQVQLGWAGSDTPLIQRALHESERPVAASAGQVRSELPITHSGPGTSSTEAVADPRHLARSAAVVPLVRAAAMTGMTPAIQRSVDNATSSSRGPAQVPDPAVISSAGKRAVAPSAVTSAANVSVTVPTARSAPGEREVVQGPSSQGVPSTLVGNVPMGELPLIGPMPSLSSALQRKAEDAPMQERAMRAASVLDAGGVSQLRLSSVPPARSPVPSAGTSMRTAEVALTWQSPPPAAAGLNTSRVAELGAAAVVAARYDAASSAASHASRSSATAPRVPPAARSLTGGSSGSVSSDGAAIPSSPSLGEVALPLTSTLQRKVAEAAEPGSPRPGTTVLSGAAASEPLALAPAAVIAASRKPATQPAPLVWRKPSTDVQQGESMRAAVTTPRTVVARQTDPAAPVSAPATELTVPDKQAAGFDLEYIIEQVGRRLARRLEVERERKGVRSWR